MTSPPGMARLEEPIPAANPVSGGNLPHIPREEGTRQRLIDIVGIPDDLTARAIAARLRGGGRLDIAA